MNHQLIKDAASATALRLLESVGEKLTDQEWQLTYDAIFDTVYTGLEVAIELYRVRYLEPSKN